MPTITRHNTGTFEQWESSYRSCLSRLDAIVASLPAMPEAAGTLLQLGAQRAAIASLRPTAGEEMVSAVRFIAQAGAAALVGASHEQGSVEARLDPHVVVFPASGPSSTVHSGTWLLALSCALVRRDAAAIAILSGEESLAAVLQSPTTGDKWQDPFARALVCAVRADAAGWCAQAAAARALMGPAGPASINSAFVQQTIAPLLDLGDILLAGDHAAWTPAVALALKLHRAFWSAENSADDPFGFLAWTISGLCALAQDRGFHTEIESPYLPGAFVVAPPPGRGAAVTYIFPQAQARSVDELHLYMDLHGGRAGTRRHQLVERDGALLAIYDCEPPGGGAHLRFEFPPVEDSAQAAGPSTLIDAGQYLALADEMAMSVPAEFQGLAVQDRTAAGRRLATAITYLREVICFIPAGAEHVPPAAFWSPQGREMREREPGRFERIRLEAVLLAWLKLSERFDGSAQPASGAAPEARPAALAFVEIIRAHAIPVLEVLGRARSAAVAAQLRPRSEDFAGVFVGDAVERARLAYDALWSAPLNLTFPSPEQTTVLCHVAPAGLFASDNELSRHFPGGYRAIAGALNPQRVWIAWKYVAPGQTTGLAFDGLVWCDDHWAWFPKPFRILAPAQPTR